MNKAPYQAFEMELPDRPGPTIRYRRPWIWRVSILVAIVVIIAIVVPLAVILPRKKSATGPKSSVIFPLYINPNTNAWDPLYDAISGNPSIEFVLVINPDNGPGNSSVPDSNYVAGITKLNTYPNVNTIGYVHTIYATRSVDLVLADVAAYSKWPSSSSGLYVKGIFFDEAPHEYTSGADTYMKTLDAAVKSSSGIQGSKTTIHNPGVPPDTAFNSTLTDITIAFEESYSTFGNQQSTLASLPLDRTRYGFIVHSTPSSANLNDLVGSMDQHAAYLFVTNLDTDYYESFGSDWSDFVKAVPS